MAKTTTLVALLMVAGLCAAQAPAEISGPGESAEAGFVDLTLRIESMDCDSWRACSLRAAGAFRGKPVALEVSIQSKGGQGKIAYRSVGAKSDELLSAMATLYKRPLGKRKFAPTASADILFLEATPRELAGKVFFAANGPQGAYAELYTNINLSRRVLEIFEKDPEYRENVLKGLSR